MMYNPLPRWRGFVYQERPDDLDLLANLGFDWVSVPFDIDGLDSLIHEAAFREMHVCIRTKGAEWKEIAKKHFDDLNVSFWIDEEKQVTFEALRTIREKDPDRMILVEGVEPPIGTHQLVRSSAPEFSRWMFLLQKGVGVHCIVEPGPGLGDLFRELKKLNIGFGFSKPFGEVDEATLKLLQDS